MTISKHFFLTFGFFYQAGSGHCLSKEKLLCCLLEGTAAAHSDSVGDEEKDAVEDYKQQTGMLLLKYFSSFAVDVWVWLVSPSLVIYNVWSFAI